MTTKDFISQNIDSIPNKDKYCSSVFQSMDGNFYSYGYHYPLLFKVDGQWYRNTTGYSNSTAKHINWADGHGAIDVDLIHPESATNDMSMENIKLSLDKMENDLCNDICKGRNGSMAQERRRGQLATIRQSQLAIA